MANAGLLLMAFNNHPSRRNSQSSSLPGRNRTTPDIGATSGVSNALTVTSGYDVDYFKKLRKLRLKEMRLSFSRFRTGDVLAIHAAFGSK
jgi:hypothetical protein